MSAPSDKEGRKAVGLRYGPAAESAPRVVARGNGPVAERILQLARSSGVPIHQDPDLVSLLSASELGEEIPTVVYDTVARVLAWLWMMRGSLEGSGVRDARD